MSICRRFVFAVLLCVCAAPALAQADSLQELIRKFEPTAAERKAGAAVVDYRRRLVIDSADTWHEDVHVVLAVLDDQAASDYSLIRVGFNSHYDAVELHSARLVDANGVEHTPSEDAVQIKTRDNGVAYDDIRTLAFSLPAVSPGSFIEYHLKAHSVRPVIDGYWYDGAWLNLVQQIGQRIRIDPVRHSRYEVDLPADMAVRIGGTGERFRAGDRVVDGRRLLLWEAEDLAEIEIEPAMPRGLEVATKVEVSSIPDWQTIDRWAEAVYRVAAEPDSQIRELVASLVSPDMDARETIRTLFYWVQQEVRYIGADLKRGGIVPHDASQVLENRYGDCKDQSVLLVAMLNAAGIQANPALINLGVDYTIDEDVPTLRFNHMIVNVPLGDEQLFLDTSGDAGAFPGLDASLADQTSLVIDGSGGHLYRLPQLDPDANRLDMALRFRTEGDDIRVAVEVTTSGVFDHRYRLLLRNNPDARDEFKEMLNNVARKASRFEGFRIAGGDGTGRPLEMSGEFVFEGNWSETKRENFVCDGSVDTVLGLFSHLTRLPDQTRKYDFESGLPSRFHLTVECPAPGPDYRPQPLAGDLHLQQDGFSFDRKIVEEAGIARIEQDFLLRGKVVPAAGYPQFRRDIVSVLEQSHWRYVYRHDESFAAEMALQRRLRDNANDHLAGLALVREMLAQARYEAAREVIERVVEQVPDNGEAQYLLGLVLGFQDEFDASDAALERAAALGYRP